MHSHDLTDRSMIVDADTAVIVDTDTMRGTRNGEPCTAKARVTAVYIKRDGAWRILAEHLAALTDAHSGCERLLRVVSGR